MNIEPPPTPSCRVNSQTMVLRHCGLDPQSPENKEILKQVQDDVVVTYDSGHDTPKWDRIMNFKY